MDIIESLRISEVVDMVPNKIHRRHFVNMVTKIVIP